MKRTATVVAVGLGLVALSFWLMRAGVDIPTQAREAYERGDYAVAVRAYQQAAPECSDLGALAASQAAALYRLDRYSDADGRYQIAESDRDEGRAARAAYSRGNCALRQACQTDQRPREALLDQAAEQFRACLDRESQRVDAGNLFADARHNLELTKLLRTPDPVDGETVRETASQNSLDQEAANAQESSNLSNAAAPTDWQSLAGTKRQAAFASLIARKADVENLCPD
jgi:hypothetical protein